MRPTLEFFAAGYPAGQPRVKARAFGGHARVYTPTTVKSSDGLRHEHPATSWKMIVRNEDAKAWIKEPIPQLMQWQGPLRVDLTFYFPRPKSHFRSNGELKPTAPVWHTAKPDRDNSDKAVLDALTDLGLWGDDKQVCDGRVRKLYCPPGCSPGCEIVIQEAGEAQ
jgi:Holliday junction resolvase RusA-like endonuclease